MFVRWKSKTVRTQFEELSDRLEYAQLVKTSWETGKPRQKVKSNKCAENIRQAKDKTIVEGLPVSYAHSLGLLKTKVESNDYIG